MKMILIIILLVFSINSTKAQLQGQAKIDSLLKELPKMKEDTNGVNLLKDLSFEYWGIKPDEGIEYGKQGVELAKEIKWKKGEANCYNSLGTNYVGKSNNPKALEYFHKALKINEELGESTAGLIHNIGNIYYSQSNYHKALEYFHKAKNINEKQGGNKIWLANNLGNIGLIYSAQSDYPKALEYYYKALKINEELGNKSGIATNLGNIGLIIENQSNYSKALEYYLKALKINEELGNKSGIANNFTRIGIIYQNQSDYPKALEFYHKALKINEELGKKSGIATNLQNIGNIYFNQSDYPKALDYCQKAKNINEELGNKSGVAINLEGIGIIYAYQSDYPKALEYFHKALKINKKLGNKFYKAYNLGNMGELFFKLSQDSVLSKINEGTELVSLNKEINLNKSIDYSLQSIEIFEEIGELHTRSIFLKNLSNAYTEKGDYKNSDKFIREHLKIKDSVFNQEKQKKIDELTKQREEDLKQAEIEMQKIRIEAQENEKQLIIYSAIIVVLLVILILALVINSRRKSNKLLLNVLPYKIAKRLKAKEHPIADHFDGASIMFVDIVGFTTLSSDADPKRIVSVLNDIFTIFDKLADKHGLEKIKTIGDAYMAVAGIPEIQADHSKRTALMALEIKSEMKDFKTSDGTEIKFRIGIDCGAVVAGVIGEKKFIYDLWSDAVNTASRMESTGESGQIQITENFKTELEKFDGSWKFELRGEFEIKGKGLMKTYYLD